MSVEKQHNDVMLICDECGEGSESDTRFYHMIAVAKDDGWLITKDDDTDEFTHMCPDCVKKLPKLK